jgi:hypothetical protein
LKVLPYKPATKYHRTVDAFADRNNCQWVIAEAPAAFIILLTPTIISSFVVMFVSVYGTILF